MFFGVNLIHREQNNNTMSYTDGTNQANKGHNVNLMLHLNTGTITVIKQHFNKKILADT